MSSKSKNEQNKIMYRGLPNNHNQTILRYDGPPTNHNETLVKVTKKSFVVKSIK